MIAPARPSIRTTEPQAVTFVELYFDLVFVSGTLTDIGRGPSRCGDETDTRIDEVPPLLAALEVACRDVGRDPGSITRSVEVLVRPSDPFDGETALTGTPEAIGAALSAFGELGIDHLQVQLRPNALAGVEAFAPATNA